MAVYPLNKAIEIIFDDREYYLKMNKSKRITFRTYKHRFRRGELSTNLKLEIVEKYGGEIKSDIMIEL